MNHPFRRALPLMAMLALVAMPARAAPDAGAGADGEDAQERVVRGFTVHAAPLFGDGSSVGTGWSEVAVRMENAGPTARKGTVEIAEQTWMGHEGFVARAPFNVGGGRSVLVHLPVLSGATRPSAFMVRAKDESGKVLAKDNISPSYAEGPLLVDVHQPSRIAVTLRGWPMTLSWNGSSVHYPRGSASPLLNVAAPSFEAATGDPILPERVAGYANATVVLMHTDTLARLESRAADALMGWVLAGGTLALVPTRVEDLRTPLMTALLGGPAEPAPAPPILMMLPGKERPPGGLLLPADPSSSAAPGAAPLDFHPGGTHALLPIRTADPSGHTQLGPPPFLASKLQGYTGGNLAPSVFGASAPYGDGEVHLLPFDPTTPPMVDDAWVHGRMIALAAHTWDRRAPFALGHPEGDASLDEVRRALDPNENFRAALGIAAILLVLYSIVAGPVSFLRASRKGKPFSPLLFAPVASLAAFFAIVAVGLVARGWRGRARHLAIVETGSGAARGAVRRFRGFFTSESRALTVASEGALGVLSIASADSASSQAKSILAVDRDGVTLEDVGALPWQTIVVQEDGFYELKGPVSLVPMGNTFDVENHTGRTLKNVLVHVPSDGVRYVDELRDGAKLHAPDAKLLIAASSLPLSASAGAGARRLAIESVLGALDAKHAEPIRTAWSPMGQALGDAVDWWPDTAPVVLAELEGGEGTKRDGTLSVESDRLLLRVIGRGGAP